MNVAAIKTLNWERPNTSIHQPIENTLQAGITDIHRDLIEQSKAGDRKSQYNLYELYVDAMFNTALRMVRNRADAEDVIQESFVSAFTALDTFNYDSTFGAWLKRIVINRCLNFLKKRRIEIFPEERPQIAEPSGTEASELTSEDALKIDKIKACINNLPDGYRRILSLYLIEGYDHREISEIAGISESTSKSQYHRAKKKLIELLNA